MELYQSGGEKGSAIFLIRSAGSDVRRLTVYLDGVPLEKFVFTLDIGILIPAALFSLFSVGACWLLRTEALRNISPTFVAISNPLSAVITGIVSLIFDFDKLTLNFAIGSVLIVLAMTLSALPEKSQSAIRDNLEK